MAEQAIQFIAVAIGFHRGKRIYVGQTFYEAPGFKRKWCEPVKQKAAPATPPPTGDPENALDLI